MIWNLRLTAAQRGIWKASELQRLLAERGLVISAGKMSGLWSGTPSTFKGSELDVICAVLDCNLQDIMIAEPDTVPMPGRSLTDQPQAVGEVRRFTPRRSKEGRSLPPE